MEKHKWLGQKLISGLLVMVILAVAAFVGLGTSSMVAASDPPPETEWEQAFGGGFWEEATAVQQTADGGYVMVGVTYSYGAGQSDVYLVKTDALGNMEWQQALGGSDYDCGHAVQQTTDGGYIVIGDTNSYGAGQSDAYLVKADALGNMEWQQTFGGSDYDCGHAVQQTADGGYIVTGETHSYGAGQSDVYLIKTDALGNMEWQQTFGGSDYDGAFHVRQTTDGGYIIGGATNSYGAGLCDFYMVKTDALGNMEWQQTFGGSDWDDGLTAEQTADGGYVMVGETYSYGEGGGDVYLVKTDALGNMEWGQTFGDSDWDVAFSGQQTTDGGYIMAGLTYSYGAGQSDAYLVKADALGNMEWQQTFGGTYSDYATCVQQTADGGYIVAGMLRDIYNYAYLVKVGSGINTPAGSNVTVTMESGTVTFPDVIEGGTTTMATLTENPVDPTPADFYVIEGNFVEITTTANYSGLITVGLSYDEAQVSNEESLRLFHWSDSEWQDVTTFVDTVENVVYGEVSSLSPFFIGEPVVLPVADAGGPYLAQVGLSVDLDGSASYHPDGTIVSYDWSLGDNTTDTGVLVSHTYADVGIYDVDLTVTDDKGLQSSGTTMVVVYDPEAGSATGGGWFWSAPGNLKSDPESEGKATFGFIARYKQGAAAGNLEFQYHVGDINLKSMDITWLVVSEVSAQFQGEGTINGEGLYTFRVLAKDDDKTGGQPDEFTIKIWEGTDTEADPIYKALNVQLGGGNIIIHN